jgi:hypothetical protein
VGLIIDNVAFVAGGRCTDGRRGAGFMLDDIDFGDGGDWLPGPLPELEGVAFGEGGG